MLLPLLWVDVFTHFLLWHLLCHYFVLCGGCKPLEGILPLLFGRCYCQCGRWKATMLNGRCILPIVADVIANVADGVATFVEMPLPHWQ